MCKDSKPKESRGKGKGKQARGGSDDIASKGKGKRAKTDGLGTCTYVKARHILCEKQGKINEAYKKLEKMVGLVMETRFHLLSLQSHLLLLHHRHRHREYRRSFHAASCSADLHRSTATAMRSRGFIAEMNYAPLMLRLVDLKNAKEDLGKNCVALYEASSGDGSLNEDRHCGKSSTLPDSALPHKECPDDDYAKTQTPKRRGRGMLAYTTHGMYSDQQSHGSVVGNSKNEAVCDSSEGDTQIRNDAMTEELRQEWKGDGRQLGEGIWMDFLLYWICISLSQSEASEVDGRRTGYHIGQLVKETSTKLKQATETDQRTEKAQRLAAERETTYAPFVPKEVLLPSNNGNELEIDSAKSHEQLALLVQSKRREQGIEEIQQQIGEVNEIFKDLAVLVHEQGVMIDDISSNIESSHAGTAQATCHFIWLAAEYSECPSGKKGGDLGWFPRGKMAGLFQDVAFSTTVGATSAPFKSTMDTTLCCRKGGRIDRTWHSKLGSLGLLTIKSNGRLASQTSWPSAVATCADSAVS
ncbi:unnamed protein product [Camellia sinensis]